MLIENEILIQQFLNEMKEKKEGIFNFMKKVEFGVSEDDTRYPFIAMLVSGGLFFIGSIPTLIAFCSTSNIHYAFYISIIINSIALFTVGAVKTLMTKTSIIFSGGENLLYGIIGGGISFSIGYLFSEFVV